MTTQLKKNIIYYEYFHKKVLRFVNHKTLQLLRS